MVALITMQMLFGFVVLPLIVILTTLISCGPPRPKHEQSRHVEPLASNAEDESQSVSDASFQLTTDDLANVDSEPREIHLCITKLSAILNFKRDLKMEPIELRWNTNGGVQKVFISNPTNIRRALKVKCSDNNLYRVNPVYSFIEPGQVLAIDIFRQNGGAKAKNDEQNPRAVFQDDLPKPMMVLPLIATSINA
ncbi:Major sperm protein [Dirofilaria immitis]|nr:Major sperm protein [Dirofilaria immitis]